MRRSSRIQIKQENTTAPKCEPIFTENIKTPLQAVENQQCPPTTSGTGSRIPKKRNLKRTRNLVERRRGIVRNSVEGKENTGKRTIGFRDTERLISEATVTDPIQPITVNKETNIDGAVSPLLAQEESNDSLLSDVANSIKIDRTIKNLSPKKFFINKNGKTTRSGRSFSPYDFATYSLLFGNLCAREDAAKDRRDSAPLKNAHKQVKRLSQSRHSRVKRRNQENVDLKRSKKAKNYRCKQYRRRNKGYLIPREGPADAVSVLRSPVLPSKIEKPDVVEDLYSEEVPAAFFFDFPPTPAPRMEGHSLPPDFYRPYVPVPVDETEAFSPTSTRVRKMEQSELDALSKISLSDSDKYEFKSAFKDAHAQVANFESYSGHEVPGGDVHKFDLMESESVEGRRFYRKRITDSRLIAWHKYNLMSSTRYLSDADPPAHARPIIKVRSNQCQRADLVWRLNQTLPPPSIEDVLDLSKEECKKIPVYK